MILIVAAVVVGTSNPEGLGKVTVSWSIVFVLPSDRRSGHLSSLLRREKVRCSLESVTTVARQLPQRETRTTCNLGINPLSPLSLFPSLSLSFYPSIYLLTENQETAAIGVEGEEARPSLDHRRRCRSSEKISYSLSVSALACSRERILMNGRHSLS